MRIKNKLDLKQIKTFQDLGYAHNIVTRERAADDMVFYWVTQWDDQVVNDTELSYKGEFNILRKAGRQIMADLMANPIQLNFDAKDSDREDGADLIDGLYLTSEYMNTTQEAYTNADQEAIVCGVGAYEYYTEYESNNAGGINQVVRCKPVYEANNNCFWDPNAKRLDKSDANWCSILTLYSEEGYIDLAMDLTGCSKEEAQQEMGNFSNPAQSWTFPWIAGQNSGVYVASFYHKTLVKDTILFLVDPMGNEIVVRKADIKKIEEELIDAGFEVANQKKVNRWQVVKYIASGVKILSSEVIAGENVPVVPVYGERAMVEGEEHYEGVTRLAKDPQRLRNFQMSYLADMVSRSPRPKPVFNAEQVQGFEFMYEQSGSENNYPYYLTNRLAADGTALAPGPAVMPEQSVPQSLVLSLQASREAVNDVANAGLPNDITDTDISGKAISQIQQRLDQQSVVYQENRKHARRRGGEVFASMAAVVFDSPREVTVTKPDGSRTKTQVMEGVIDKETGEPVMLNDITNLEFDVYANISASYSSKREQTLEQLEKMATNAANMGDMQLSQMLLLKQLTLVDGVAFDDIREYANKELLLSGVKQPETPEEEQMLAEQAMQQQEPSAADKMAQAETMKGEADIMEQQNRQAEIQIKAGQLSKEAQIDQMKVQVDTFKAQTDRMAVQVDAQFKGAEIDYKRSRTFGQKIDNVQKMVSSYRPEGI
ncbi:MAG: portal protein [Nitrosomonadaceae bacterium]